MDLTSLLTNLQLQPLNDQPPTKTQRFTLFPNLPTELRLKILSHALPTHITIKVHANLTVADPSFGLYLIFTASSHLNIAALSSFIQNSATAKTGFLSATRALNLLLVNKEFRSFYIEQFPLSLPTGRVGAGRIRFAPAETVYIHNFDKLLMHEDFGRAFSGGFRVQDFWKDIERLAVPITALIWRPVSKIQPALVVKRFGRLRELRAYMWDGFEEQVDDEIASKAIRGGMERHLVDLRERLRLLRDEEEVAPGKEVGYVLPEMALV